VIDADGTIYQLVPLALMCRHVIGLNHVSIGIEHVGTSDAQVMGRRRQLTASLALTRWLAARHRIERRNVIGHAESLKSPFHHERVARLRNRTHGDFGTATMRRYRGML
jgi:beta-N-acetylhexosaminidase